MTSTGWDRVALRDYCQKIGSGSTPRGGDSVYVEVGTALIRSQNVYNGEFAYEGLAFLGDSEAEALRGVTVQSGDVLLNITGDSVARCCVVPGDVLPARVNQQVAIIRPRTDEFIAQFLAYYLISPFMQETMLSMAGGGGTRKALTKEMIERFAVPKPPLDHQERIVAMLGGYDGLIDNIRRRIKLLEDSVRLLFDEWFVRQQVPPHLESMPDDEPLHLSVADLCIEAKALVLPEAIDADTPYIGLEHMPRRAITLSDWGAATDVTSAKLRYAEGDVIFGKIRPYFHKVGIALTDGVCSSDAIVMRPRVESWRSLLLALVSSDAFIAATAQGMKEGSKMPRADWKQMQAYSVRVPNPRVLVAFSGVVEPVLQQVKTLALQARALRTARDLLLPRLMSGELTV